jgi:hypothetical protein
MTQIQLPLLIREKIKDYLSFTEWRDKMTQVCIEYHKNYKYSKIHKSVYFNNEVEKLYNYRSLKRKVGHNVSEFILGHKVSEFIHNISKYNVAKLSPNY